MFFEGDETFFGVEKGENELSERESTSSVSLSGSHAAFSPPLSALLMIVL